MTGLEIFGVNAIYNRKKTNDVMSVLVYKFCIVTYLSNVPARYLIFDNLAIDFRVQNGNIVTHPALHTYSIAFNIVFALSSRFRLCRYTDPNVFIDLSHIKFKHMWGQISRNNIRRKRNVAPLFMSSTRLFLRSI